MGNLVKQLAVANTLGEGVIWNNNTGLLYWTDIQENQLYQWDGQTEHPTIIHLPHRLGAFGFTDQDDMVVAAFDCGFALFNIVTGAVQWLVQPKEIAPGSGRRLNDGRVDRSGRFWCGSMVEDNSLCEESSAALYCLDKDFSARTTRDDIAISNAICWSPDGSFMYFADSPKQTIWRYRFDQQSGQLADPIIFATTARGAYPDGAVTDAQGYLWNAQWGAAQVVRYAPDGSINQIIKVPASQPSCVAFGGTDMTQLFVTSARENLDSQALAKDPQAGDLFVYQTDTQGIPEPIFNIKQ